MIKLEHVVKRYSGERDALKRVSLVIEKSEMVFVAGHSGAGKSTFVRALLGLWPVIAGEIRIDGAAPADYDPDEFGSQVGYLPQDIVVMEFIDSSVWIPVHTLPGYECCIEYYVNAEGQVKSTKGQIERLLKPKIKKL